MSADDWAAAARMAPSARNTQPWRFAPAGDRVLVSFDSLRSLPASDPTKRDLYLGLGAAIESARLGAGRERSWRFVYNGGEDSVYVGDLEPGGTFHDWDERLARSLTKRGSGRGAHQERGIPAQFIAEATQIARDSHCELTICERRSEIHHIADLLAQATCTQLADETVHQELWQWLRLHPDQPAYSRDGLTAGALELRGIMLALAKAAMPPERMRLLCRAGLHRLVASDAQSVARKSAAMVLLGAPAHDAATLIRAGAALLQIWTLAGEYDLRTHPLSAILDDADTAKRVPSIFGCRQLPTNLFRIGFVAASEPSPRLPIEEIVGQ